MVGIFQIACGEAGRHYDDLFLKYDVMFMGPGDFGDFREEIYRLKVKEGLLNKSGFDQLKNFFGSVNPGDIILLRMGYEVIGIGLVDNDLGYSFKDQFDDIYGWDLRHVRRVIWQDHLKDSLKEMQRGNKRAFQ